MWQRIDHVSLFFSPSSPPIPSYPSTAADGEDPTSAGGIYLNMVIVVLPSFGSCISLCCTSCYCCQFWHVRPSLHEIHTSISELFPYLFLHTSTRSFLMSHRPCCVILSSHHDMMHRASQNLLQNLNCLWYITQSLFKFYYSDRSLAIEFD